MALLEVKNLSISFGGLKAVDDFHVADRKRTAVRSDRSKRCWKNYRFQPSYRCI